MSTTTAADLLERADLLTRTLRNDEHAVTADQWGAFDHAMRRALTEVLGPHGTWIRENRTTGPLQTVIDHYPTPDQSQPDREERVSSFSSTDTHPLTRLTRTLAAFADLMHQPDDVRADVLRSTTELSNVTARLLTITAVAARYTMVHMPMREAIRPLTTGTFAENILPELPTTAGERLDRGLRMLAAVTPTQPMLEADRLDLAIHRWDNATTEALASAVPCAEVLHTLTTQGTHLYGVTARLYGREDRSAVPPAFRPAVQRLARVDEAWIHGLTTLTPPSHQFIAASRDLYEQLDRLNQQLTVHSESVEPEATAAKLARAAHRLNRYLSAVEQLPEQLIRSELMFAPARQLAPHADRITEQVRGRLTTVRVADATELISVWHAGVAAAREATLAMDLSTITAREPVAPAQIEPSPIEIGR